MRVRISFVVVLCAFLFAGWVGVASAQPTPPFDTNAECLECHDVALDGPAFSKVDFGVGSVDYTACAKCHQNLPDLVLYAGKYEATHYHFGYLYCTDCHNGNDAFAFVVPPGSPRKPGYLYSSPLGFFATAESLLAGPDAIHKFHDGTGWVESTFNAEYPACSKCHAAAACSTCHVGAVSHTDHATPAYSPVSYKQATGTSVVYTPSTCVNLSCHAVAAAGTEAFVPSCSGCHPVQTDTHGYDKVDHVADDTATDGVACSSCHALDLSTEHAKPSSSSNAEGCATCHPAPRNTFGAWDQSCVTGGCHTTASSAPMHAATGTAHAVVTAGEVCLGCHDGADLGSVHAGAVDDQGATSCLVCHTPAGAPETGDCTVCHFTFEGHYDATVHESTWSLQTCGGAACHTTNDLMGVHAEKNPAFQCNTCHKSADANVLAAISGGATACDACHTGISQEQGHRSVHWAAPPLVGGDPPQPNYAYSFGTQGGTPTTECAGCHTGNLVDEHMGVYENGQWTRLARIDSAGQALDCATCHASLDPQVGLAIATGDSRCDACHVVHDTIPATHASTYADERPIDCAGCHSADLSVVHSGSVTATTPSGAVLTGCAICHDYTEGARGAEVQAAIAITNDTRCTACHAQYHSGSSSHEAVSSASLADCGPCHGTGGEAIDVQAVHAAAPGGACAVCHANPARVPDLGSMTAECAGCHTTQGTDYHREMAAKHLSTESAACNSCHHSNPDVSSVHRLQGCLICHNGTVVTEGVTAACTDCHPESEQGTSYHLTLEAAHVPADASSAECARCHQTTDIRVVHDTYSCATCHTGACMDCHAMHGGMGGGFLLRSTACVSCHPVAGTDYHVSMPSKHTFTGMDPGCTVDGCHAANTLPEVHEPYLARYPQYEDTCALCHLNVDPERVDWASANADCSSCHQVHSDLGVAHTATASGACVRCHDTADVRELHPACSTCHNATVDTSGTVDCVNCHADQGVDYHAGMAASHVGFTSSGCAGTGCHPSGNVVDAHARYVGDGKQFSQYQDTCALCHLNEDPDRIDWNTIPGATCGNCHGWPHDRQKHTATSTASQECVACHETNWVIDVHGIDIVNDASEAYKCDWCHNNPVKGDLTWDKTSSDCEQCHDKSPASGKHYDSVVHTASDETGCINCHYLEMAPEHNKPTAGPVDCVTCHETKVDTFTAAWDKTCAACHATKHQQMQAKHASSSSACGGVGCHDISDVSDVHKGVQGGGCRVCHTSRDELPGSTDCASCHAGFGADHHELHNTAASGPAGCTGCHFGYIDDEHAALGLTCATCHDSTDPVVQGAIAASDVRCLTCHPDSAHNAQQAYEFDAGNASLHRTGADKPGMRSSFSVKGANYTMSLPSASSFLRTGYTYTTMLTCDSCHAYSGAAGPHGATMQVNLDPAYSADWTTAYLSGSSTGMARPGNSTASDVICAKCHDLRGSSFSNNVHDEGDHQGSSDGKCVLCHTRIPHGWGRPRLLGATTDPLAYRTLSNGLSKFRLRNYTPNGWSESDCNAACGSGEHSDTISTPWPSVMAATPPGMDVANLAAGKVFSASRYVSSTYAPRLAGDQDTGTWWWSNSRGASTAIEFLLVDLESSASVSSLEIEWSGDLWARDYRIYTSTNGSTWTQVYYTTSGTSGINAVNFTPRSARYVKVECRRTGTGRSNGYGIAELRVYE